MATKHIIAVDPGDVRNGFAYFKWDSETKKADTKIMRILTSRELEDFLKIVWGIGQAEEKPDLSFVVENFRIDEKVRGKVFQWSEVLTVRNIGKVEMLARWMNAPLIIQEPAILAMARKWSPLPLPKGHPPDDKSAFLHGVHYMMQRKLIMTPDQVTLFGQERL